MAEGLFDIEQFEWLDPIGVDRVVGALVRVEPHRRFAFELFADADDADDWSGREVHSDGSETLRVGRTHDDLERCADPEFSNRIGGYEFCELVDRGAEFPNEVPIDGHANGVAVADRDVVLTCFHLLTGPVEAAGRGESTHVDEPVEIDGVRAEVPTRAASGAPAHEPVDRIELVSNPSSDRAFGEPGLDAAVLRTDPLAAAALEPRRSDLDAGDSLYLVGHGMRTARPPERCAELGYENVDHDLRISTGAARERESETVLLADFDAAPGHSGSPVVDAEGRLVGIYVGSTGNGLVDPDGVLRRVLLYGAVESTLLDP